MKWKNVHVHFSTSFTRISFSTFKFSLNVSIVRFHSMGQYPIQANYNFFGKPANNCVGSWRLYNRKLVMRNSYIQQLK